MRLIVAVFVLGENMEVHGKDVVVYRESADGGFSRV